MNWYGDQASQQSSQAARKLLGSNYDILTLVRSARALRNNFFPAGLFADAAWDILLDLYEAHLMQFRLSVSKIGQGTDLPATTVLRWLKALESKRLIQRYQDPADARRVFIELTIDGQDAMDGLFAAIEQRMKRNQFDR